jgi:hypothetical protein
MPVATAFRARAIATTSLTARTGSFTGRAAIRSLAASGVVGRAVRHRRPAEDDRAGIGSCHASAAKIGADEAGLVQVGAAEVGVDQRGAGEVGAAEVGALEVLAAQVLNLIAAFGQVPARSGRAVTAAATPAAQRLGTDTSSLSPLSQAFVGLSTAVAALATTIPALAGFVAVLSMREAG